MGATSEIESKSQTKTNDPAEEKANDEKCHDKGRVAQDGVGPNGIKQHHQKYGDSGFVK